MAVRNSIAFLGVGNMGAAIANGILKSGVFLPQNIIVYDALVEKCRAFAEKGCVAAPSLASAVQAADIVLL